MKSRKSRSVVESILTVLLFSLQHIPVIEPPWNMIMFYPLFVFLLSFPRVRMGVDLLFSGQTLTFGQVIFWVGLVIFLMAGIQFLRKRGDLVDTGFYAVVRHPQYLGIIVITLGITILCLQVESWPQILGMWMVQVFGYILLAHYEERHLIKEYGARYQGYMQKVSFMFPVPRLPKIPELVFTFSIILVIAFLCLITLFRPP